VSNIVFYRKKLNFFSAVPPAVEQHKRLTQQISTGLCIVLFIASLTFPVYLSLMKVTKTVTIQAPTIQQYAELYSTYPQMLTCPCSKPSIPYGEFLNIQYTFHQVCNSDFVTQNWISYLAMSTGIKFPYDFRSTSPSAFQALAMFCNSIQATIVDNLSRFYSNQYVSVYVTPVTPFTYFADQIQSPIQQFISSTTNSFLLSLSMIRGTIQGNALFSGLQTNYEQMVQNGYVSLLVQNYHGCNCASSAACIFQSAIYNYPNVTSLFNIPGFYTGCYVIESLLQSNLQCFFNQTCINILQTYLS